MRYGMPKRLTLAAGILTSTLAMNALAQDAGADGATEIVIHADMLHEFLDFPFMEGRVVGGRSSGEYAVTVGGSGLLSVGETGRIECLVNSMPVSGGIALISPCTMTAENADMLFAVAARNTGTIGAGGGGFGTIVIVGGTGGFDGAFGQGIYETGYSDTEDNALFVRMEFELRERTEGQDIDVLQFEFD